MPNGITKVFNSEKNSLLMFTLIKEEFTGVDYVYLVNNTFEFKFNISNILHTG